jgi:DNA-binding CsgD family transcriptional regulator
LDLIGDVTVLDEVGEFRYVLLDALRRAVPSDWVAINELGPGPELLIEIMEPPIPAEALAVFVRYAEQNPLLERYLRTGDGRAQRISDVVSREDFHARQVYTEFYRQIGVEHQMAFTLPSAQDRILAVILSRRDEDFTDDERDLIEQARPFLIQFYQNVLRYTEALALRLPSSGSADRPQLETLRALGLTKRQAEVLQLLATGAGERDIAERLAISHRTVQKHLQLCYRALGVDRRSRAAALAWSALDGDHSSSADLKPIR